MLNVRSKLEGGFNVMTESIWEMLYYFAEMAAAGGAYIPAMLAKLTREAVRDDLPKPTATEILSKVMEAQEKAFALCEKECPGGQWITPLSVDFSWDGIQVKVIFTSCLGTKIHLLIGDEDRQFSNVLTVETRDDRPEEERHDSEARRLMAVREVILEGTAVQEVRSAHDWIQT